MKITAVTPSVVRQWISTYIVWEGFISRSLSSICYNDYVLPEMKIQSQSQQSSFLTTGLLLLLFSNHWAATYFLEKTTAFLFKFMAEFEYNLQSKAHILEHLNKYSRSD